MTAVRRHKWFAPRAPENDNGEPNDDQDDDDGNKQKKTQRSQRLWRMVLLATFCGVIPGVFALNAYLEFGVHALIPVRFQYLGHSAAHWQAEILPMRTILMIGGPHRGGTTILWKCIREHPDISNFGDTTDTAAPLSEGIFMQEVYPHFGLGKEPIGGHNNRHPWKSFHGGLGQYALQQEAKIHLTEKSELITEENQAKLLNRFGYFWNMSKPVLLEKSPPNAVISRFLQALINLNVQSHESQVNSNDVARFLFITRHPLANALAHRAWPFCRRMPLIRIVENWVRVNEYMLQDMDHLQHVKLLKMEEFQTDPDRYLRDVFEWIGLDPDKAANRTTLVHQNTNQKYKKRYCKWLEDHRDEHAQLETMFGDRIRRIGYEIQEWSQCASNRHPSEE